MVISWSESFWNSENVNVTTKNEQFIQQQFPPPRLLLPRVSQNCLAQTWPKSGTAGCTDSRRRCDEWAAFGPKLAQVLITGADCMELKLLHVCAPKNPAKPGPVVSEHTRARRYWAATSPTVDEFLHCLFGLTSANINRMQHHDSGDYPWYEKKSPPFFVNKVTWLINVMNDHAIP